MLFADRTHKHFFNGGVMTPEKAIALCLSRANQIDLAIIAESARWGDQRPARANNPYTKADWWKEVNGYLIGAFFPVRTQIVLDQLRNRGLYPPVTAPVFQINGVYQHGGHIAVGGKLSMTGGGTIWYTLDGSDPRLRGRVAPSGPSTTLVPEDAPKRILVPTGPVLATWRGGGRFEDSTWTAVTTGPGGIGYERGSGYQQYLSLDLGQQMYNKQATCYIRIPFTMPNTTFSNLLLKVRYDDGFIAYLNGTEVTRRNFTGEPQWNSIGSADNPDAAAVVQTTIDISTYLNLLVPGANLLAIHGLNGTIDSSDFLISVELAATRGASVSTAPAGVAASALRYAGPMALSQSTLVKARVLSGSTWSALNEAVFAVGPVAEGLRVSELMYHPAETGNPNDPNTEYIELTNIAIQTINLSLVRFTEGIDYTFPSFELPAGGYGLVVKDIAAFQAKYGSKLPVVGEYAGSLSNGGEQITLVDAAGTVIEGFAYQDAWYKTTDGEGYSLTVKDPKTTHTGSLNEKAAWTASAQKGGSPGRAGP